MTSFFAQQPHVPRYFIIVEVILLANPKKLTNRSSKSESSRRPSDDPLGGRRVTGKDLTELEELDIKLDTLVSLLSEKGIVSKREYANNVMMRLHETSKAKSFEDLDEEI